MEILLERLLTEILLVLAQAALWQLFKWVRARFGAVAPGIAATPA